MPLISQRNLTELVVAVTDENIVGLFAALLAERRVLLTASKLSTVRWDLLPWGRDASNPFHSVPPLWEQSEEVAQWLQLEQSSTGPSAEDQAWPSSAPLEEVVKFSSWSLSSVGRAFTQQA